MIKTKLASLTVLLFSTGICIAQSRLTDNETHFYVNRIPDKEVTVQLTGAKGSQDADNLNKEITSLSKSGGGIIHIKKGTYYLSNIELRSNIHIKIDAGVVIEPDFTGIKTGANISIFDVVNQFPVENVAITNADEDDSSKNTWFTVNIPMSSYRRVNFAAFSNVKNFKISGLKITDSYTVFSAIVLNLPKNGDRNNIPVNGIVKDVLLTDAHVGYGVIQIQAGKTILCKNLDGEGGITLRIETGAKETNMVNETTVDDIVGRNIIIRNGDAAVDLSPHRVDQGRVDVEGIVAINSTYAVRLSAGFLDKKTGTVDHMGTFNKRSYIGDITVTGGVGAQIKSKDFQFFDCAYRDELIKKGMNPDEESYTGKSIGAIRDNSSVASGCTGGCYEVVMGKITKTNNDFVLNNQNAVYNSMSINGCEKITPSKKHLKK
jgi:hypothetical protein